MTDKQLRLFSIIAAGVGLLVSIYLTYIKFSDTYALCGPIGDCESVNSSRYAEIAGIPIALLGALAFAAILVILIFENRVSFFAEQGTLILFGMSLTGVLYSAYLTYVEIWVLEAICPYCVISALALVSLLVFTLLRLFKTQGEGNVVTP